MSEISEFVTQFIKIKNFYHSEFYGCRTCGKTSCIIDLFHEINYLNIFTFCNNNDCYEEANIENDRFRFPMHVKDIKNISEEEYQLFINLYNKARKVLLLT